MHLVVEAGLRVLKCALSRASEGGQRFVGVNARAEVIPANHRQPFLLYDHPLYGGTLAGWSV